MCAPSLPSAASPDLEQWALHHRTAVCFNGSVPQPSAARSSPASGGLRIGIALQGDKTPDEYAALAALIDRYAFDVVSVYNDLFFQPAFGPLLLMARHLRRVLLGPAAVNPYTAHPVEIAGNLAVLDLATHGRAYLGLARGSWLEQIGLEQRRPLRTVHEAVLLIQHLLEGRRAAFDGQVFRLAAGAALQFRPLRARVPVTLGTWGRRTARLAGQIADEVKVGGSTNPWMVRHLRPAVEAGVQAAGRPPGSVGICLGAVTVVDDDRARARARARREVALYLPVVAPHDPTVEDHAWLAEVRAAAGRGDYGAVADRIPDSVLDRFAFAGAPQDIIRQIEEVARAGATRVEFGTPHGLRPDRGVRLLGERVLPYFKP